MTVWYDLTTSLRNSSHNGIANVEWSLYRALNDVLDGVRAFAMVDNRLVILDDTDVEAAVYSEEQGLPTRVVDSGQPNPMIQALSEALGPRGRAVARELLVLRRQGLRAARAASRRARRVRRPNPKRPELISVLTAADVVISAGAEWQGDLARLLAQVRQQSGCHVVTMVFDLIPLSHPHLAFHKDPELFRSYYTTLIGASDLIFCISEESRLQLATFAAENHLGLPATEVLRLGDAEQTPVNSVLNVPLDDFFLWVGTIERRKNLEVLYDALRILESDGLDVPTIVVVGSPGWGTKDLLRELSILTSQASRNVHLVGPLRNSDLDRLYATARALLFPSFYEGWGLPIREAAIRGLPVAAGDSPAAREAAAGYDAVSLIDPDNPEDWAQYLRTTSDTAARVEPAPAFVWRDSASALVSVLGERGWMSANEKMANVPADEKEVQVGNR